MSRHVQQIHYVSLCDLQNIKNFERLPIHVQHPEKNGQFSDWITAIHLP